MDESAGRYELLDMIGAGGMAEVYRARMLGAAGFSKIVAIKRILAECSVDDEFVRRFVDEARLTAALVHPNICQILDFGLMEDRHFIAMEYVEGLDLSGVLNSLDRSHERVPLDVVLYVTTCILRGLKHAHEAEDEQGTPLGIVHRDVSPHNVLLSINGDVKLSDLGAATANPEVRSAKTQKHFRLGKVLYMAPEQRRLGPVDGRADVYSTGILLTEMILGITRFQKIANMYLAGLCSLSDEIAGSMSSEAGQSLAEVIERATQEDPENRYPTAGEMLAVVDQLLRDWAPGTSVDRVARLVKRAKRAREDALPGSVSGSASVSGPVEAVSLHTGDYVSVQVPSEPTDPGLSAAPTDPRKRPGDDDVTLDVVAPSGSIQVPQAVAGLDDVPTAQQPQVVAEGDVGPEYAGGLDDVPTLAMVRLPGGEYLDDAEADTVGESAPYAPVGPPPMVELDSLYDVDPEHDASVDTEIDSRGSAVVLPAETLDDIPLRADAREGFGRRAAIFVVLGLALFAGLGVGAVVARGRWSAGAGAPAEVPSRPLPALPDASPAAPLRHVPEGPPPEAPIALDIAPIHDGGGYVEDGGSPLDGAPPELVDAGRRAVVTAPRRRGFGYLNINSLPYGVPFVDGARVATETPVARLKLATGRHRVKVFFPQEKRHVTRHVRIRAGETSGVVLRLDR